MYSHRCAARGRGIYGGEGPALAQEALSDVAAARLSHHGPCPWCHKGTIHVEVGELIAWEETRLLRSIEWTCLRCEFSYDRFVDDSLQN
jgi:hypothetical protein